MYILFISSAMTYLRSVIISTALNLSFEILQEVMKRGEKLITAEEIIIGAIITATEEVVAAEEVVTAVVTGDEPI